MGLKQPGTTSSITFLTTALSTLAMIAILIGGHLVLGFLIYSNITDGTGMQEIAEFTHLPLWSLWLSMAAALALDLWILFYQRKDRLKRG